MPLKNGTILTKAGFTAFALTLSVSFLTGRSSNDSAAPSITTTSAASTVRASQVPKASASKSPPLPSTQAPVKESPGPATPAPEVPAQEDANPNAFMSIEQQAPIITSEQAIDVMKKAMHYNPDLVYDASPSKYGNFDVKIRSQSLMNQGGSGTAGIWEVTPDGSHAEKSTIIR